MSSNRTSVSTIGSSPQESLSVPGTLVTSLSVTPSLSIPLVSSSAALVSSEPTSQSDIVPTSIASTPSIVPSSREVSRSPSPVPSSTTLASHQQVSHTAPLPVSSLDLSSVGTTSREQLTRTSHVVTSIHPSNTKLSPSLPASPAPLRTSPGVAHVPAPSLGDSGDRQPSGNLPSQAPPSPPSPSTSLSHDQSAKPSAPSAPSESSHSVPSTSSFASSVPAPPVLVSSSPAASTLRPSIPVLHPTSVAITLPQTTPSVIRPSSRIISSSIPSSASEHITSNVPAPTSIKLSGDEDNLSTTEITLPPSSPAANLADTTHPSTPRTSNAPAQSSNSAHSHFTSPNVQANADSVTGTSTVTDKPETTLSSPVFFTATDSNHHTTLTDPPVFTSVGISTLSGGGLVSVTHVIANPTGIYGVNTESSAKHGFFSNSGAVAGVFLVVGVFIAVILGGTLLYMRRRKRRQRQPPFIRGVISRPISYPDNPFEDPRDPPSPGQPNMRYSLNAPSTVIITPGLGRTQQNPFNEESTYLPTPLRPNANNGNFVDEPMVAFAMTRGGTRGRGSRLREQTTPENHVVGPSEEYAASSSFARASDEAQGRSHSKGTTTAESSPSMYPSSLPPVTGEDQLPTPNSETASRDPLEVFAPQPIVPSQVIPVVFPTERRPPPVLPPRSPLRAIRSPLLVRTEFTSKESTLIDHQPYEPLTPPESSSSHSAVYLDRPNSGTYNPFTDPTAEVSAPEEVKLRDTFYARRKSIQSRPSTIVEWKQ